MTAKIQPIPTIRRDLERCLAGAAMAILSALVSFSATGSDEKDSRACALDVPYQAEIQVSNLVSAEGNIRVQIYNDNPDDWLAKGRKLVRVDVPVDPEGYENQRVCVPVPDAGTYAFVVLHDKNANGKADIFTEGFGFSNNPKLGLSKPDHGAVITRVDKNYIVLPIDVKYVFGTNKEKRSKRRRR